MFKIINIINTIYGENCASSRDQVVYKPGCINVLVSVDHNSMAANLTRSECEGFLRSAVYPIQWMELMMICCGMAVKRMGMLGVMCEKGEGTDYEDGDNYDDW